MFEFERKDTNEDFNSNSESNDEIEEVKDIVVFEKKEIKPNLRKRINLIYKM